MDPVKTQGGRATLVAELQSQWTLDPPATSSAYQLFVPLHYERGYAYPLIVWLHGTGDDERQIDRVLPLISMRNYVGAAPSAPGPKPPGQAWSEDPASVVEAERRIDRVIESAESRLNIHPRRIFLAGYADGGSMAWRIALRRPLDFAGAISLGGPFPRGLSPLAAVNEARALPLMLLYGSEGRRYGEGSVCQDLRLLHSAGLDVAARQYPCGDELTTGMLSDVDRWVMGHVTGQPVH